MTQQNTKVALNELPLAGAGDGAFRHLPDYAQRVKAAIRTNAVMVARSGNEDAIERFRQDVAEVFGGDFAIADQFLIQAVYRHNVRYGYYDFVTNVWMEV